MPIPRAIRSWVERVVGGPARARVVALFACVLALESADLATVGAAAPQLEAAFHISNTQLGLIAAISTTMGAIATLPAGALTDRICRVRLLAGAVALWAVAMVASAAAQTYGWMLLSRLGLGAVTAAAGPTIASLTGDYFPAGERGKIYGYVLSGELIGAGIGFVVSGSVAGALSWRWSFGILALPAAALALVVWRKLPEPARGGQSHLAPGARRIVDAEEVAAGAGNTSRRPRHRVRGIARRAIVERGIEPVQAQILRQDPRAMTLSEAVRYVLAIRTNRWLIAASAVGYFFFAGVRTFAVVFVRGHFQLGQSIATVVLFLAGLGALAGVLISGRTADVMIRRGRLSARLLVAGIAYLLAAGFLVPTFLLRTLVVAVPTLIIAGAGMSAANPPLDAARLDVMPAGLWGRAEGVRTLLRQTAQAGAPLIFGLIADALGGAGASVSATHVSAASTRGLQYAFLIMLVPLAANGALALGARRTYPSDVATALASEREVAAKARPARGDDRAVGRAA